MALKPHVDAITGTDHVLQQKNRNLKALDRLKSAAYGFGCYIPDLKEDIETMALEAKEVLDWQEIPTSEQGCVAGLIDTIQAELEQGAKWDGPAVWKRVKRECALSPSEVEYGAIASPRGPPREEYEVIGVETTQELFDVLGMGKLPQKREELR